MLRRRWKELAGSLVGDERTIAERPNVGPTRNRERRINTDATAVQVARERCQLRISRCARRPNHHSGAQEGAITQGNAVVRNMRHFDVHADINPALGEFLLSVRPKLLTQFWENRWSGMYQHHVQVRFF